MSLAVPGERFVCGSVRKTSGKGYGKSSLGFADFAGNSIRICMSVGSVRKTGDKPSLAVFYTSLTYFLINIIKASFLTWTSKPAYKINK